MIAKNELYIALCYSDISDNYTNALKETGKDIGIIVHPVCFDCGTKTEGMIPFPEFDINQFDGLLIPGGGDIDPSFYGQDNQGSINPEPDIDRCQFSIADAFVQAKKPILGICRGHQLMNVYFGGSLCQDIPEKKDHMRLNPKTDNRHIINAEEGSVLQELYGSSFAVNSSHHQAVKETGKGLRITARCTDGTIEALEHESLPILLVQFHPERMDYRHRREDTVAGGLIFEYFLRMILKQTEMIKNQILL